MMRANHPNEKIGDRARAVAEDQGGNVVGFDGRIICREDNLDLPLHTKKPTVFAVWNDLFHKDVPDVFIHNALGVMANAQHHTYLILTKRAERMGVFFKGWFNGQVKAQFPDHIWFGVTAENQAMADERIPHLLQVPGRRFLSLEPMLGPINLFDSVEGVFGSLTCPPRQGNIHAVLLGGESGSKARPLYPAWVRSVRDQCAAAGVPFNFKQWGEFVPCGMVEDETKYQNEIIDGTIMCRVGKKKAGRTLDGVVHDELPWDKPKQEGR
jgi:protein gp37